MPLNYSTLTLYSVAILLYPNLYNLVMCRMSLKNALFSQVYLSMIGWKSVMNPDDRELSDLHWNLKVIFIFLEVIISKVE